MAAKKKRISKPLKVAAAIASTIAAGVIGYQVILHNTSYTVTRVLDGDTFETQEKQRVRINGIQAPEEGFCGNEEAKTFLESEVLGKKVFLKVLYLDSYRRQIADVYLADGTLLAANLARAGSVYVHQKGPSSQSLLAAGNEARDAKWGIFGTPCTQTENTDMPTCTIKANINAVTGNKTYHMPGCKAYDITHVQRYLGDQWFCTEREAQKAGFTKAATCPN